MRKQRKNRVAVALGLAAGVALRALGLVAPGLLCDRKRRALGPVRRGDLVALGPVLRGDLVSPGLVRSIGPRDPLADLPYESSAA